MATRTKALVKPELLIWARESAGFQLPEAADKLQVSEEKLTNWEAGGEAPSIPQLRKIASVYKRPLAVFYLQEVPKDFQVIRDLRRLPGMGLRRLSPNLILEIRRANQRRQLALELMHDLGVRLPAFNLDTSLRSNPENVGQEIRQFLQMSDSEQKHYRDGRAGFKAWRKRIEDVGVLVFQATAIDSDTASGFAISEKILPIVVVNRKDKPTRRTFSLIHELAHLMLHVSGVSDLNSEDSRPPEDQKIEIFCNQVAAATLMPKDWLLSDGRVASKGRSSNWSDDEIAELAKTFSVSREALLRRLLTFNKTTESFYRQKREQYLAEFLAEKQRQKAKAPDEGIPRNMPRETMSNLGEPFVRMVLDNYYSTNLTLSDVAGYLGIKTKHISKLETMVDTP
jgi:Zn-dependent peptidase ImmA (M78 family)/DNA-binding XRE family transcriptional regulator